MLPPEMFEESFRTYRRNMNILVRNTVNGRDENGNTPLHIAAACGAY